ncbi:MAG TPA: response regulator transcription factor [Usitatibacter sp.]|nr:response regulator transcription factor [Usitatibacter sp.]
MQTTDPTRVFIVDDSASVRARLVRMLDPLDGVKLVGEAGTAREAIEAIDCLVPHSVLLDLNLPDASGVEVMRTLRPRWPAMVFVVLTNHPEPQYRRACERAGAAYFFDKSNEFHRVPEVVRRIASTRQ